MAPAEVVTVPISPEIDSFQPEPRCPVCRNEGLSKRVNDMLARGAGYAGIVRALSVENAALDERDRVTVHSVRNHEARHFPVQSAAKAVYREILERRARENAVDFVEGLATAITPMAFLETVMVKAYETLVTDDTRVDVNTAIAAASKLQAMIEERAGGTSMSELIAQTGCVIEAVRSTVPPELWPEISRRIGSDEANDGPVVEEDWEYSEPSDFAFDTDSFGDE
jgi:hypothetical protein